MLLYPIYIYIEENTHPLCKNLYAELMEDRPLAFHSHQLTSLELGQYWNPLSIWLSSANSAASTHVVYNH